MKRKIAEQRYRALLSLKMCWMVSTLESAEQAGSLNIPSPAGQIRDTPKMSEN
jgi:hypothetical protein